MFFSLLSQMLVDKGDATASGSVESPSPQDEDEQDDKMLEGPASSNHPAPDFGPTQSLGGHSSDISTTQKVL